ncbi:MAG: hypothetical protein J6K61_04940 [Clostridia bacterium]|nr:hypothetical protein [Clostridia bacterium]
MKRILCLLFLLSLILGALCLTVNAQEPPLPASEEQEPLAESATATTEEKRVFTNAIGDFLRENAEKIFCALACIASLIPGFLYKTGLLPLLRSALSALSDSANKAGKKTEEFSANAEEKLASLQQGASAVLQVSENTVALLQEAEERLAALEEALAQNLKEKQKTTAALQTETELLFRMLQCANLPQAQKDAMSSSFFALQQTLKEE